MKQRICAAAVLAFLAPLAGAQTSPQGLRKLPARDSAGAGHRQPGDAEADRRAAALRLERSPKDAEAWKAWVKPRRARRETLPELRAGAGVKVEPTKIAA